jgi:hypothetical protein
MCQILNQVLIMPSLISNGIADGISCLEHWPFLAKPVIMSAEVCIFNSMAVGSPFLLTLPIPFYFFCTLVSHMLISNGFLRFF